MAFFNRVLLIGNLTRDPELRYTPSGTAVCDFGLAINRRYRTPDGEQRDETCFVDISVFGRQAETISQYMSKGRQILIEGRLRMGQWTTPDGQKRSKLSVVGERFQFLGGPPKGPQARPEPTPGEELPEGGGPESDEDSIPF